MFESRLRLVFALLILLIAGLGGRAFQLQVKHHADWQKVADQRAVQTTLIEPTRGRILDIRGRELAVDQACIDACVDYEAILPQSDDKWVRRQALERLRGPLGDLYRAATAAQQTQMREDQIAQVRKDLAAMWATLGDEKITGSSSEQIEQKRQQIIQRVEMLQRYVWYSGYTAAAREHESRRSLPWYSRWLGDEIDQAPQLDQFDVTVGEQHEPHVILPAISSELANYLGKNLGRMPGLVLRTGQHRDYPYGPAASHAIGYLNRVPKADIPDPTDPDDRLKRYLPNDLIGKGGVEALGEGLLRGQRGRTVRRLVDDQIIETKDPLPGQDVRLTIDIELEKAIEDRFAHPLRADNTPDPDPIYGAAVVIDVPTGQIRALVSYPNYDLNEFEQLYPKLVNDDIQRALMNRATRFAMEPGSTVKPIVGIAGLAEGVLKPYEGIECTGYLVLNGRRYHDGKCWIMPKAGNPMHHPGHQGTHGNPDGFLTYPEALERSCNVYFETAADRLGIDRLSLWMKRFGLGRPVGIGLAEAQGMLPESFKGPARLRNGIITWTGGIGQNQVAATPLQMANVAATLARGGLWVRPTLTTPAIGVTADGPDRVQIPGEASFFALAKEGMTAAVNSEAGTGKMLRRDGLTVAGKTGTAQVPPFFIFERDEQRRYIKEADGSLKRRYIDPSTPGRRNPQAPWYRGSDTVGAKPTHAWFIGFAPAENPQIAFAVFVEYGGAGGKVAGSIARGILDAAIKAGYLAQQDN